MDRIAEALIQQGLTVTPMYLFRDKYDGNHFVTHGTELIYRIDDDNETVMLPLYRRLHGRSTPRNSFAGIDWFANFLIQHQLGIKRLTGVIRAIDPGEMSYMTTARIARAYQRLFGARCVGRRLGEDVLCLELEDYRPIRDVRKLRHQERRSETA